jgi:hypothetical protein
MMPFDWSAFYHKHRALYQQHGLSKVVGPAALRIALWAVGQAGWFFDDLAFPDWRATKMRGPIFIVGHQRSGTTFLHRLLDLDQTNIRSLKMHEMLMPSVAVQRVLSKIEDIDKRFGSRLAGAFARKQDALFGPMDPIHRIRLDEVEEDEFVLWTIYASAMCVNDSPFAVENETLDALRNFDHWSMPQKTRALNYYKACVLKKVFREPCKDPSCPCWYVSKNPAFSQKIPDLLRVFPDALFVYLIRDPAKAIASRLSLIRAIWRHRFSDFDQMSKGQIDRILKDSVRTYLYAHRDLSLVPGGRRLTIRYGDLVNKPSQSVERIYKTFGINEPDTILSAALGKLNERKKNPSSTHRYDLAEFGLTKKQIADRLAPVYQSIDFD